MGEGELWHGGRQVLGIGFTTGLQHGTATGPRTIVRHDYYTWHTREHPQRVPGRGSRPAHTGTTARRSYMYYCCSGRLPGAGGLGLLEGLKAGAG